MKIYKKVVKNIYFGQCDLIFKGNMNSCKSYKYDRYNFLDYKDLANNENESFQVLEVEIFKII